MTGTDNLGSNFDIQKLQEQTIEFTEVSTSELAEAQRMKSSISTSDENLDDILQHLMPDNPQIDQPDQNLLNEGQKEVVQYNSENLTSEDVNTVLKENPEFQQLLKQSGLDEQNVTEYVRNNLLEHNPTSENISQLATGALLERMELASSLQPNNTNLQNSINNLKVGQYTEQYPQTKMLKDVLTNQFVQQGHSQEEAQAMANEQIVGNLAGLKGATEISEAINSSLSSTVGNQDFVSSATSAVNLFKGISNSSGTIATRSAGTDSSQKTGDTELVAQGDQLQTMVDAELDHIETMISTIRSLGLPGEIALPFLKFLAQIAKSLEELKHLKSQFAIEEGKKGMQRAQAKIEAAAARYQEVLKKIKEALKKLKEMEDMKDKMGPLKTFGDIANIMSLVMAAIVALVIFVVLTALLGPIGAVLALVIVPIIIGPAIAMFTINQTGDMKVASQFFAVASNKMMEMMGVDNPEGWEGPLVIMGAIAAIAVVALLVAAVALPFLILLAIAVVAIAVVVIAAMASTVVLAAAAIIIAIVMVCIMVLIAIVVLAAVLATIMMIVQVFIGMLMESGILEIVADKIGDKLGMSKDQKLVFQAVLKGAAAFGTSLIGLQTPEQTMEADYAKQRQQELDGDVEEFSSKERYEKDYQHTTEKLQRLNPYLHIKPLVDLVALSLRNNSERSGEETAKELDDMSVVFNKMIKMMEKLLANLLSGGQSGKIGSKESLKDAFSDLANFADGAVKQFIPDSEGMPDIDIENLWPMIETLQQGFPGNLSEEDYNNLAQFQTQAGAGDLEMEKFTKG